MRTLSPTAVSHSSRDVFFNLFHGHFTPDALESARDFLCHQLDRAAALECDLPDDMNALEAWMHAGVECVGHEYQDYLDARQAGGPRRYFRNKAHALNFLKGVAPTKLVDGAWLYGLLERWQDPRFGALIQTYLEELGEGLPSKNHVVLYRKLLAAQGLEHWQEQSDEHFVQGAIQLSLAYSADAFLPEVIGFNLGYEQLPLHLLISAYELKELNIDPYYFTLHITVDNADSGHAKKAVEAIFDSMPHLGNADDWYRRVRNGYMLNNLGASTNSVIQEFDLEREMVEIFERKAQVGQYAHSDYRRVNGRTVNDWLSHSDETTNLVTAMEAEGWFKRGQDPQNSRFWRLIQSEKAKMFGVFSAYEQQVIYDWIANDADASDFKRPEMPRRALSPTEKQKFTQALKSSETASDFDSEVRELEKSLHRTSSPQQKMSLLIELMSPANHHSAPGLKATQIFNEIFN